MSLSGASARAAGPPPAPAAGDGAGESELADRLRSHDPRALSALYRRFSTLSLVVALRVLGDREEAEEVVQETFLYAWRESHRYDPGRASLSTWLTLITRSRAIDRLRSRRLVARTREQAGQETPTEAPSRGEQRVLHGQRRRRLRAALAALPEEQRQVIELAYYRGLSQSEIACRLQIPLGTVKTRTLLAFRKLRRLLDGEVAALL